MSVQSQIERIKNTVNSQTELIQEISNILDSKSTPTQKLQDKTITPTATNQVITADTGYGGLNKVTVNGDAELVPENIKEGVNIFGVTGSMSSHTLEWTTLDISPNYSVFAPDPVILIDVDLSFNKMPSYILFEVAYTHFTPPQYIFATYLRTESNGSLYFYSFKGTNDIGINSIKKIESNNDFKIRCTINIPSGVDIRYMALYQ